MAYHFCGSDFGPLVFGREILRRTPKTILTFEVQQGDSKSLDQKKCTESCFWSLGFHSIVKNHSRFGRIGLFFDRKNTRANQFCEQIQTISFEYKPLDKRAEKNVCITSFEAQVLHEMANEGLSDTVEFRRLARKYIRRAKHAHVDSIFFLEVIFGEEKTRNILQHIAGSQIKLFFPSDFLGSEFFESAVSERKLEIVTGDGVGFTRMRAEKILRTKLEKSSIQMDQ